MESRLLAKGSRGGIALEDYGTMQDDDTVKIVAEDELGSKTEQQNEIQPNLDCCMSDGKSRIDYVLVYEEDIRTTEEKKITVTSAGSKAESDTAKHLEWRNKFLRNLTKAGVQSEEVTG